MPPKGFYKPTLKNNYELRKAAAQEKAKHDVEQAAKARSHQANSAWLGLGEFQAGPRQGRSFQSGQPAVDHRFENFLPSTNSEPRLLARRHSNPHLNTEEGGVVQAQRPVTPQPQRPSGWRTTRHTFNKALEESDRGPGGEARKELDREDEAARKVYYKNAEDRAAQERDEKAFKDIQGVHEKMEGRLHVDEAWKRWLLESKHNRMNWLWYRYRNGLPPYRPLPEQISGQSTHVSSQQHDTPMRAYQTGNGSSTAASVTPAFPMRLDPIQDNANVVEYVPNLGANIPLQTQATTPAQAAMTDNAAWIPGPSATTPVAPPNGYQQFGESA